MIAWLSGASYTVYLFHMPIVLALRIGFRAIGMPPVPAFLLTTCMTLALCFALHAVIMRWGLLALLFNGKPQTTKPVRAAL